jgi:hypothetical protein
MFNLACAQVAPSKTLFPKAAPSLAYLKARTWRVESDKFEPEILRGDCVLLDVGMPKPGDIVAVPADNDLGFHLASFKPGMDVLARVVGAHRVYR